MSSFFENIFANILATVCVGFVYKMYYHYKKYIDIIYQE